MPFDFATVTSPFRMQPGLRRMAPGTPQLTPNRLGSAHLGAKLKVLARHASQALLAEPGFDSRHAVNALASHAAQEHPTAFSRAGSGRIDALRLGWSLHDGEVMDIGIDAGTGTSPPDIGACLRALPPEWRLAGLLSLAFEEDFAVLDGNDSRIPWLAVCLPSHWSPEEKVGRHFAEVHAPVADSQTLVAASAHLARLVTGADRWERFVWTITPRAALDAHPQRCAPAIWPATADADALAAHAFFRTEHQTFIPLGTPLRQAVFTIRVDVQPLTHAIGSPARAQPLHDALASMTPAVLAYRGLAEARERLLHWLAARAA